MVDIAGVKGLTFDTTKADGQYRKTMGSELFRSYLKNYKFTSLKEGLSETIRNFANETRI